MPYAVETRDLTRIFAGKKKRRIRRKRATGEGEDHLGPVTALDQVSIQIRDGELFGMLGPNRSEEHTSELQSRSDLVCRLLLEKKKRTATTYCARNRVTTRR